MSPKDLSLNQSCQCSASNEFSLPRPALRWVYLNHLLGSLWPDIRATSGIDKPSSKNREMTSCRRSWKCRFSMPTRFRNLSQVIGRHWAKLHKHTQKCPWGCLGIPVVRPWVNWEFGKNCNFYNILFLLRKNGGRTWIRTRDLCDVNTAL